ncbi:NAD-dependent deacetylase [Entamoeba marina]
MQENNNIQPISNAELFEEAVQLIKDHENVIFFTGAGISAESGINTFRDPEHGVWANKIGLALFGTPFGWNWIPSISWSFFKGFLQPIVDAQPNNAHHAITRVSTNKKVRVITQNVDALHQRAGIDAKHVAEVHGTVYKFRCCKNGHPIDVNLEHGIPNSSPLCAVCGSKARPDATLFTEALPADALNKAYHWIEKYSRNSVMVIIGTTGIVYPAAGMPESFMNKGGKVIEINIEESSYTPRVNCFLKGKAAEILPQLIYRVIV